MGRIAMFFIPMILLCFIGIPIGIFFAIRALIRYNAKVNKKNDSKQDELDRMKIEDL